MVSDRCRICENIDFTIAAGEVQAPDGIVFAPKRHVTRWVDCSAQEHSVLAALISNRINDEQASFSSGNIDGHFFLRQSGSGQNGPMSATKLIAGGLDPLLPHLQKEIDRAKHVDLAVAFAFQSGVELLFPWFEDLLSRGGKLRLIVSDYLDASEPNALRRLMDLQKEAISAQLELWVIETAGTSFHPKAWAFDRVDGAGSVIVGSSNMSRSALTLGTEWNLFSNDTSSFEAVKEAFNALMSDARLRRLTEEWVATYQARRTTKALPNLATSLVEAEPEAPLPEPHSVQVEALRALEQTRVNGHRAGMVVLATGLGKTWLAAFDSRSFARILFVAHREEILAQAMATFRKIRPDANFGNYTGSRKDAGDVVFASVQTLARLEHLLRFDPTDFDYIVIDEFHHAAASSYGTIIDYFRPKFLLGLTATPERTDGGDLLALCGENLVFRCDFYEGIKLGILAPFHYFGVPDDTDYEQIPWRSSRFDEQALTAAVATKARAENALEQLAKHGNGPAIGFCVSMRHADFMAQYFRAAGLRAVAVHSGPSSAPRATSLEDLAHGRLDILFAVDIFNEGLDVPNIGTVLMLRPTESSIIFLQQLGRGLRKLPGKTLKVIDYIGNHRAFSIKARALLNAGQGDRSLSLKLDMVEAGSFDLPPGCEVTYDLRAYDFLRAYLKLNNQYDQSEAWYIERRLRSGVRPLAIDFALAGFVPHKTGHGGWFDFVRDMGDDVPEAARVHKPLLEMLSADRWSDVAIPILIAKLGGSSSSALSKAKLIAQASDEAKRRRYTIPAQSWANAWAELALSPLFKVEGEWIAFRRTPTPGLGELISELVEWRLQAMNQRALIGGELAGPAAFSESGLQLWHEYLREAIPPHFGVVFNKGNWQAGMVALEKDLILLTTLNKANMSAGAEYEDKFISPHEMQWQSQNSTHRQSKRGDILSGQNTNVRVHLFVRPNKLRGNTAAPFTYFGQPKFVSWEGDRPITIHWRLPEEIPPHLRKVFKVPEDD